MNPLLILPLVCLLTGPHHAQPNQGGAVHAFVAARSLPICGPPIESRVLLDQEGKILGVGVATLTVPLNAVVVRLKRNTILPGVVDPLSHIAGAVGVDGSAPIQPEIRVFDSLYMREASVKKA